MIRTRSPAYGVAAALVFSLAGLAQAPASLPLPDDRAAGAATVTEAQLREWLGTLASPEFGGRGTGQDGFRLAAEYMSAHFAKLGLEPAGVDGSFLQPLPWTVSTPNAERSALVVSKGGTERWRLGLADGLHGTATADLEAHGSLCVVVTADAEGNDLTGLDLAGAGVIVVTKAAPSRNAAARAISAIRRNVSSAGGTLLALADDALHTSYGPFRPSSARGAGRGGRAAASRDRSPATVVIRRDALTAMLKATGTDLDIDGATAPAKLAVAGAEAAVTIELDVTPAPAWNVLAILRGADPELKDEFVGVGCHLDHLGRRGDTFFPGADDDGSGSTGLMAIAQSFAKNPNRPARSILFMAFCGEEMGLLGSEFFAANPTVPLEKLVAELQIDMIGRDEEGEDGHENAADNLNSLHLIGSEKLSSDLHELCLRLNDSRAKFELEWDEEGVFYRSDHWNFARKGVPIAFFFTGFHRDYHKPTDTPDKIDYPKLGRIARYVYDIAYELADAKERPLVDEDKWQSLRNKGSQEPAAPLRKQ